jgi:two-component system OmpR family response regulator
MTRVLVIDDDPHIREVVTYALGDEGYEVDEASSGRAGLEVVNRHHPDIIILDMKMPDMDGWEFARLYHQRYDRPAASSSSPLPGRSQRAADIRAESYVSKRSTSTR